MTLRFLGQPTTVARPPPLRNFNPAIVAFFTVIAANTAVSNAGIGPSVFSSDVNPSVILCTN